MSPLLSRALHALLYAVIVYLVVYILGVLLANIVQAVEIGDILKRFAPVLALLAGLYAFFSGGRTAI